MEIKWVAIKAPREFRILMLGVVEYFQLLGSSKKCNSVLCLDCLLTYDVPQSLTKLYWCTVICVRRIKVVSYVILHMYSSPTNDTSYILISPGMSVTGWTVYFPEIGLKDCQWVVSKRSSSIHTPEETHQEDKLLYQN